MAADGFAPSIPETPFGEMPGALTLKRAFLLDKRSPEVNDDARG
jgi:hypothetical protein